MLVKHGLRENGNPPITGNNLNHEIPLGTENRDFRTKSRGMASRNDLMVQDEVLIENREVLVFQFRNR